MIRLCFLHKLLPTNIMNLMQRSLGPSPVLRVGRVIAAPGPTFLTTRTVLTSLIRFTHNDSKAPFNHNMASRLRGKNVLMYVVFPWLQLIWTVHVFFLRDPAFTLGIISDPILRTGASSGIGEACARHFAQAGSNLV